MVRGAAFAWDRIRDIVVITVGVAVTVFGIITIPFPGPGWAIVFAGLGILSTRFPVLRRFIDWLRRMLTDVPPLFLGGGIAVGGVIVLLLPLHWWGKTPGVIATIVFGCVIAVFQLPQLRPIARRVYAKVRPDAAGGAGHAGVLEGRRPQGEEDPSLSSPP